MSNPEFGLPDPQSQDGGLSPDVPVENPPYEEGAWDPAWGLRPGIPVEDLPYQEDEGKPVEEKPLHHLASENELPQTVEGHIALLHSAIEEAESKGWDEEVIRIADGKLTVAKYLATIINGSRSGLTHEERKGVTELFLGPDDTTRQPGQTTVNTDTNSTPNQASPLVHETPDTGPYHPMVVTDLSDEDDPYERGRARQQGTRDDRIAP